MAELGSPQFSFRYNGSSFDNMIETLGGAFGAFSTEPMGKYQDFNWGSIFGTSKRSLAHWLSSGGIPVQYRTDPRYCTVFVNRHATQWRYGVTSGARTAQAVRGQLLFYDNFEPDSVTMHGRSNLIDELLLSWSVVLQTIEQTFERPLNGAPDLQPEMSTATSVGQTIGNLAATMMNGMRDNGPLLRSPIAMSHITQALAELVIRLVPHRLSYLLDQKPSLIAPRHVRRAIEFMQANISQPVGMTEVAAAAGVSIRALQLGFRAFKDTTPLAYLMRLRLGEARQDLLDPENNQAVSEICLKWGFFHFGRFSAVYRATYGENPSETKKRAGRP